MTASAHRQHGHSRAAGVITGGGALMLAVALTAAVVSGRMWWLVKPGFGPVVLAAAAVLAVVGLARMIVCVRRVDASAPESVASLLTIIAAALVAVAAVGPATGALAADKPLFAAASAPPQRFAALPAPPEVPYVPLYQIAGRLSGTTAPGSSIAGREIRVIGQVTTGTEGSSTKGPGWQLARMQMNCCAADTLRTVIKGVGAPPAPVGTWVDGTARAFVSDESDPQLEILSAKQIGEPRTPYEF